MKLRLATAIFALLCCTVLQAAPIDNRMTVVEAIDQVRNLGFDIAYSSQLVKEWMLVRETPVEEDPIEALRTTIAVYGLDLVRGPGERWLIVKSDKEIKKRPTPVPPTSTPVEEPVLAPALEEITIVASRHALFDRRGVTDQFLSGEEIRLMPHIADDAFRALHHLPGVAANDFQAPFNLRGGALDEVKIQLDGLEIIEPFHMRTLFSPLSIIDPGVIDQAQVLSGGFTAVHGNYMSGVVDIETVRPDSDPVHELGVSFVSAFARSGGEFANGRGSYFVSGRRGYLDLITEQIVEDSEELKPRYNDVYARASYDINDSTELSLQTLLAVDDVRFLDASDGEDFREDSSSSHVWLSAQTEFGSGLTAENVVFASRVESTEDGTQANEPSENISRYYDRDISTVGVQSHWVLPVSDRHMFKAGVRYREHSADFDYRLNTMRRSDFVNNGAPFFSQRNTLISRDGEDLGAHLAYRVRLSDRFVTELGLRWDQQTYATARDDTQLSPRINLLYHLSDRAEVRVAWGEFYQPQAIQDLQVEDADLRYYEPERAEHSVIGFRYAFVSGMELQLDAYNKRYTDVRPRYESLIDVYEFAPESNFDRAIIAPQSGRAFGAEATLRSRSSSSFSWWVNYTWSKTDDDIDGITVRRSWDQRDSLMASLSWRGQRWSFSAFGRYHSGWPRTALLVAPVTDGNGNIVGVTTDLSERNRTEFDDYVRLDLRVSRRVPLTRGSFEYYLELFNVLGAKNQCCTKSHVLSIGSSISASPKFDDYLPRFPSFGFVWRFGPGAD